MIIQDLPGGEVEKEERMILMLIEWRRICRERISWVWNPEIGGQLWAMVVDMIVGSSKIIVRKA